MRNSNEERSDEEGRGVQSFETKGGSNPYRIPPSQQNIIFKKNKKIFSIFVYY
tara:strand:- start:582 stop:740 length:159 start_codon:yes stop_codon:yes gene_type:complete